MFTLYIKPIAKEVEISEDSFDELREAFLLKEVQFLPVYNGDLGKKDVYDSLFNAWMNLDPCYSDRILGLYHWDKDDMPPEFGIPIVNVTSVVSYWPFLVIPFNENVDLKNRIAEAKHEISHTFIGPLCSSDDPCISKCDYFNPMTDPFSFNPSSHDHCENCKESIKYKQGMAGRFRVLDNDMEKIRDYLDRSFE